jgi:sugar-specific transcriptional regulator TrmB
MLKLLLRNAMFIKDLIRLGFSEKEAIVYLMLLRVGPSPVSTLARRVNMKRVTVYSVLEALCARALITYEETSKGKRYIPLDPECLLNYFERENAELRVRMDLAENCVEKLNGNYAQYSLEQKITFYRESRMIIRGLKMNLRTDDSVFILSLHFSKDSSVVSVLKSFLKTSEYKVFLCLPEKCHAYIKSSFPKVKCLTLKQNLPLQDGILVVQNEKVFFISNSSESVQMTHFSDLNYGRYFREILLWPYFN